MCSTRLVNKNERHKRSNDEKHPIACIIIAVKPAYLRTFGVPLRIHCTLHRPFNKQIATDWRLLLYIIHCIIPQWRLARFRKRSHSGSRSSVLSLLIHTLVDQRMTHHFLIRLGKRTEPSPVTAWGMGLGAEAAKLPAKRRLPPLWNRLVKNLGINCAEIFKFRSFLQSKSVINVCKLLSHTETSLMHPTRPLGYSPNCKFMTPHWPLALLAAPCFKSHTFLNRGYI